jgi:hypothetical protein
MLVEWGDGGELLRAHLCVCGFVRGVWQLGDWQGRIAWLYLQGGLNLC